MNNGQRNCIRGAIGDLANQYDLTLNEDGKQCLLSARDAAQNDKWPLAFYWLKRASVTGLVDRPSGPAFETALEELITTLAQGCGIPLDDTELRGG